MFVLHSFSRHFARLALAALVFILPRFTMAEDTPTPPQPLSLWNGHAPVGDGTFQTEDPEITFYPAPHPNGAAAVICPGGGYGGLVIGGIVLKYRLPHGHAMVPLLDAQRAVRMARFHSKDWAIDPKRIGIFGFSAGGHVASTEGTHFDAGSPKSDDPVERVSCRPDFMVLVYPVITMGEKGHAGSRKNLLGPDPTPELIEKFSNEKHVTPETPPTFLAHAENDTVVPAENSRMFYEALQANKVPSKYLPLPSGGHGLNGYKGPMWDEWQSQSIQWLADQKIIPQQDVPASY
jgi:hypothetical protein